MAAESEADSQEGPGASRVWGREKGENLKVTERVALGEYGADRGRGFGPYLRGRCQHGSILGRSKRRTRRR